MIVRVKLLRKGHPIRASKPRSIVLRNPSPPSLAPLGFSPLPDPSLRSPSVLPLPSTEKTAFPDRSSTVSSGPYSITIPAGVVDRPAPVTVTPLEGGDDGIGGYAASFHIADDWEDGTKTVRLTMPLDPDLPALGPDHLVAVVHDRTEREIISGDELAIDPVAGTVSFDTRSLSKFLSTSLPTLWLSEPQILHTNRTAALQELMAFLGYRPQDPVCPAGITEDSSVDTEGSAFVDHASLGHQRAIKHCVDRDGDGARWTLVNNTSAALRTSAGGPATIVNTGTSGDLLTDLAFARRNGIVIGSPDESYDDTAIDIAPGGSIAIVMPDGQSGKITFDADTDLTIAAFLLRQVGTVAPAADAKDLYEFMNDCGWSLGTSSVLAFAPALRCTLNLYGTLPGKREIAKKIAKRLFIFDAALALTDLLWNDSVTATLAYDRSADPPIGSPTGTIAAIPREKWTWNISPNGRYGRKGYADPVSGEARSALVDRQTGMMLRSWPDDHREWWDVSPIATDGTVVSYRNGSSSSTFVTVYEPNESPREYAFPEQTFSHNIQISQDGSTVAVLSHEYPHAGEEHHVLSTLDVDTGAVRERQWTLDERSAPGGQLVPVELYRVSVDGSSVLAQACRTTPLDQDEGQRPQCAHNGINATEEVVARFDLKGASADDVVAVTAPPTGDRLLAINAVSPDATTAMFWNNDLGNPVNVLWRGDGFISVPGVAGSWCGRTATTPTLPAALFSASGRYLWCQVDTRVHLVDVVDGDVSVIFEGTASEVEDMHPVYVASDGSEVIFGSDGFSPLGDVGQYRWTR